MLNDGNRSMTCCSPRCFCQQTERDDFLRQACAGDDELEQEVRSLLTSHRNAGSFLEDPAIKIAAQTIALAETQETSDELLGRTISHYRVWQSWAAAGWAQSIRRRIVRIGRHVALKLLLVSQASDRKAVLRFEHEARAISSLNHPNICTLYEVEEYEGQTGHRDGTARGPNAGGAHQGEPRFPDGDFAVRDRSGRCPRSSPCGRPGSSRYQACEPVHHHPESGKGPRLRPRQADQQLRLSTHWWGRKTHSPVSE